MMKRFNILLVVASLLFSSFYFLNCYDDTYITLGPANGNGPIDGEDNIPPKITSIDPPNGTTIDVEKEIIITFNEEMDTESLIVSGEMAIHPLMGQIYNVEWRETTYPNDTLVIQPGPFWEDGTDQALNIEVRDGGANLPVLSDSIPDENIVLVDGIIQQTYSVDGKYPVCTATPESGTYISPDQTITIVFSKSMDTDTLVLGGSMIAEAQSPAWGTGLRVNDKLIINPTTQWSEVIGATLTIEASDVKGYAMEPKEIVYNIDGTDPFVLSVDPDPRSPVFNNIITNSTQSIEVIFSEEIDISDWDAYISGNMLADSDGGQWSSGAFTNDTLTISPTGQWTESTSAVLYINACDLAGNCMPGTLTLSYLIDYTPPAILIAGDPPAPQIDPPDGSAIQIDDVITITFDEPIDDGSMGFAPTFSGTVLTYSDPPVVNTDDYLSVSFSPTSGWPLGISLTLSIDSVTDWYGNTATNVEDIEYYAHLRGEIDVIDSDNAGKHNSMAVVDHGGNDVHIFVSYFEKPDSQLRMVRSLDNGFTWEDIAIDNTSDVGRYSSIGALQNGTDDYVYISYYDDATEILKFARSSDSGGAWTISTIDNATRVGENTSLATINHSGNNYIYITYYAQEVDPSTKGLLRLARSTDGGVNWTIEVVDDRSTITDYIGLFSSVVAVDDDSGPPNIYVAYYYQYTGAQDLVFRSGTDDYTTGITWDTALVIDSDDDVGSFTSLDIKDNGTNYDVYVAYYDTTNGDLSFLKSTDSGVNWGTPQQVDTEMGSIGLGEFYFHPISIKADAASNIYITYAKAGSEDWYFNIATSNDSGTNWDLVTIDTKEGTGEGTSFGLWNDVAYLGNTVYTSYHNYETGALYFARSDDNGQNW